MLAESRVGVNPEKLKKLIEVALAPQSPDGPKNKRPKLAGASKQVVQVD